MNEIEMKKYAPRVIEYSCFREFLRDYYFWKKKNSPIFSYRNFSRKAGFKSPNFLKLVIEGHRNISSNSILKFTKALELNTNDELYFKSLVLFNQTTDPIVKSKEAKILVHLKCKLKRKPIEARQFEYYANWYNIPIRELLGCQFTVDDPAWIAKKFIEPITHSEIKKSLLNLSDLGLIEKKDGKWTPSHKTVNTNDEVSNEGVKQYHKKMISLAGESIDKTPKEKREISSVCIPVTNQSFLKVKNLIQEFKSQLLTLAEEELEFENTSDQQNQVYQLNFQFFPLTREDV